MMPIQQLLGEKPNSELVKSFIQTLSSSADVQHALAPEIKSFPDAVYYNYFPLGFSAMFVPIPGYCLRTGMHKSDIDESRLVLDSIDIYNVLNRPDKPLKHSSSEVAFSSYPNLPLNLELNAKTQHLMVSAETTGKELVQVLGEPDRKGGGAGPSSGSIGIWCEWSKVGVLVEFGGITARGPQAWEQGKDAVWRVLTMFSSSKNTE
jgi:hypothetical protein